METVNWKDAFIELGDIMSMYYKTNRQDFRSKLNESIYYTKVENDPSFEASRDNFNIYYFFDALSPNINPSRDEFYLLDPIHVFALINQSSISQKNRVNNVNFFLAAFNSKIRFGDIDFTGCPRPLSLRILSKRSVDVMMNVWSFFELVKSQRQDALNKENFTIYRNWFGIEVSAFTIFLFWIEPKCFMPCDKNTLNILLNFGVINKKPNTYVEYKKIIPFETSENYSIIAEKAWQYDKLSTKEKEEITEVVEFTYNKKEYSEKSNLKIVAIKPLTGCDKKYSKVLELGKVYVLDRTYIFNSDGSISYNASNEFDLYSIKAENNILKINIQAIVGKNGSGKSSIIELFYWAINNISKAVLNDETELEHINGVCLEIYFFIDKLYKLQLINTEVLLQSYSQNDKVLILENKVEKLNKKRLSEMFYTTVNNYSHFALNEKELGKWVHWLFHKNDGYKSSIVISPYRKHGNIDINKENELARNRYLFTILNPQPLLKHINSENKFIEKLFLNLNSEKNDKVRRKLRDLNLSDLKKEAISQIVFSFHKIVYIDGPIFNKACRDYILYKLHAITETYKKYNEYANWYEKEDKEIRKYLTILSRDKSHITNKLNQAINFLKHNHLRHRDFTKEINVNELTEKIQALCGENIFHDSLRTIDLLPPSFLSCDFILNDGSKFSELSSGEKQRIYTVNSIIYHLMNINSVELNRNNIKYSFVNVIFDEVELYFHPDMQRTFIDHLLFNLRNIALDDIRGVNFIFITHSPFILSDIPISNILFLNGIDEMDFDMSNTFGANIHDLLKHNFFLKDGYMGEFVKKKIVSLVNFLSMKEDETNNNWGEEKARKFINIVGEPIIKERLVYLFEKKFISKNRQSLERQIEKLQQELNHLNETDTNS